MQNCKELIYLWQDRDAIRNLAYLKSLVVDKCLEFIYFVAGEGDIELPGNLETIELTTCVNLEKLPSKMHTLSSLKRLRVEYCPKLVPFPETGIPTSVISLTIRDCKMMQSLPRGLSVQPNEPSSNSSNNLGDMMSCLQELTIDGCDSLPTSSSSEGRFLPATLKRPEIWRCKGVESQAEINVDRLQSFREIEIFLWKNLRSLPQGLHTLSHLTSLTLYKCPALELERFPPLPPGISSISLEECPRIKSLPNQPHRLTCLGDLRISRCGSITRFPDGGLPPQLQRLELAFDEGVAYPPHLPLQDLMICDIVGGGAGEEEDLLLPPLPSSLLHLDISWMGNVERLCGSLPSNLQTLRFDECPKLRELPQDGLPPYNNS